MEILGVKYPNINAKLKAKYSKKINQEDLKDVIKQNNFKSAVLLLKSKNQKFKDIDENTDRLEIEQKLEEELIENIKEIYKLLDQNDQKEVSDILQIFEIKCIKSIL